MAAQQIGSEIETASWGRRIVALLVDWVASTLVVILLVGWDDYFQASSNASFYVLGVYVVESALLSGLVGGSFGQLATRLRVVRMDGDPRPLNLGAALIRSVLIALVIPPLVFRPDGRGLHDVLVGSATVTLQTSRAMRGL